MTRQRSPFGERFGVEKPIVVADASTETSLWHNEIMVEVTDGPFGAR